MSSSLLPEARPPRGRGLRRLPAARRLPVLLGASAATGIAIGGALRLDEDKQLAGPLAWVALALIPLLVARQLLMLRHDARQARELNERVDRRTAQLAGAEAWFRTVVQNSQDVITVVSADGLISYQSPSIFAVLGVHAEEVLHKPVAGLLDPGVAENFMEASAKNSGLPFTMEIRFRRPGLPDRQLQCVTTDLRNDPEIRGWVVNSRDVSEARQLEAQLHTRASTDTLTGLANRSLFRERVTAALRERGPGRAVAVLFLDLDGFKEVNDTLGHAAGDTLLVEVAQRLRRALPTGGTVARLGGDEFGVLVARVASEASAVLVAERVLAVLDAPMNVGSREVTVRGSVGIATATDTTVVADADELLRNADLAMYRAKSAGTGRWRRYESSMHGELVARLEMEDQLRTVAESGELRLMLQPVVDLASGRPIGAEALVRWQHPTRGLVSPLDFVPVAEATGSIVGIGRWVLFEACRQAAKWQSLASAPLTAPLTVSVNVSTRQLSSGLVTDVRAALSESGLSPRALILEVTESVLVDRTSRVLAVLADLRAMGVRLSVDDFGTGYSSLAYLSTLPLDGLKIDRSFVCVLDEKGADDDGRAVCQAILDLARSLRLRTIAEGIETPAQLAVLLELGCELGQGYLFARPLTPGDCWDLMVSKLSPAVPAQSVGTASGQLTALPTRISAFVPR